MHKVALLILASMSLHASLFRHIGTLNQPTDGNVYLEPSSGLIGFFDQRDNTINIWHIEHQDFRKYISAKDVAKLNKSTWMKCHHQVYGDYLSYGPFWQMSSIDQALNIEWPHPEDPICNRGSISIINWETHALYEIPWAKEKYCALIPKTSYFASVSDTPAIMIRDYQGRLVEKLELPEQPRGDIQLLFSYVSENRVFIVAVYAEITLIFDTKAF